MKKPFNVLSSAALSAVLAGSVLVPAAVSAAETPAEQNDVTNVVIAKDSKNLEITLEELNDAIYANILTADEVSYVTDVKGKHYSIADFNDAIYASESGDFAEALQLLEENNLQQDLTVIEGTFEDGELVGKDEQTGEEIKVESVSAINAALVQVTFSDKVDIESATKLSNYVFTKNNSKYGSGHDSITTVLKDNARVLEDGKTVVFELVNNENAQLDNGDKFGIDVKNAVKGLNGGKVEAYGDTQKEFKDEVAPVVTNAVLSQDKESVRVYFNEPVSFNDADFGLTIDNETIYDSNNNINPSKNTSDLLFVELKNDKGQGTDYYAAPVYYTDVPLDALKDDLTEVGTHDVTIYNLRDIVSRNGNGGNKVQLATTSYEVTKEADAAELVVTSVTAKDFNSLNVNFNRAPKKATIKVLKGDTVFYEKTLNSVDKSQKVDLPYTVLSLADGLTTLYGKNEIATDVRVIVENYEDENQVLGATYDESLKLQREAQTPTVLGESANRLVESLDGDGNSTGKPKLTLPLKQINDASAVTVKDSTKVKVYDKNNVQRTVDSVAIDSGVLEVELDRADGSKEKFEDLAPFKVVVDAGALEVETDEIDVPSEKEHDGTDWVKWNQGDFTNKLNNKSFETKVSQTVTEDAEDSNFKHIEGVTDVTVKSDTKTANGVKKNVITVEYTDSMKASAAQLKNYKLDGKALPEGTEISMDTTSKIVTITLPEGSVAKKQAVRLQITKDVMTANNEIIVGNINTKEAYMTDENLVLVDNVAPLLVSAQYGVDKADAKSTKVVELTFSEALDLSDLANFEDNFEFKANGTKAVEVVKVEKYSNEEEDANKIVITLDESVSTTQKSEITVVEDDSGDIHITDANDNQLTKGTKITLKAGDAVISDVAKELAEEEDAAQELAAAKTNAKEALDEYADIADYTINETELTAAIASGKTAIDGATDVAEVESELSTAKLAIDAIKDDQKVVDEVAAGVANTLTVTVEDTTLPSVDSDYTIEVKTTSEDSTYDEDGLGVATGTSIVVYTVKHNASGKTADTAEVTVTVTD